MPEWLPWSLLATLLVGWGVDHYQLRRALRQAALDRDVDDQAYRALAERLRRTAQWRAAPWTSTGPYPWGGSPPDGPDARR